MKLNDTIGKFAHIQFDQPARVVHIDLMGGDLLPKRNMSYKVLSAFGQIVDVDSGFITIRVEHVFCSDCEFDIQCTLMHPIKHTGTIQLKTT